MLQLEKKISLNDRREKIILFAVIFVSFIVHFFCACFYKSGETYLDEYVYLQSAAGLANGDGLMSVHGEAVSYWDRFLYTVLLAPGFLISNGHLRIVFFSFLNSFLASMSLIPAYGFFRDVIEDRKAALVSVTLFAALPINLICMTFMVENLLIPFMYLAFCKLYRLYESFDNNVVTTRLYLEIFILTAISFIIKKSAMLFLCVFVATWGVSYILQRKSGKTKLVLILFVLILALCFTYIEWVVIKGIFNSIVVNVGLRVWGFEILHSIMHIIMAGGFFVTLLPVLLYRKYPQRIKYFIIALNIAVALAVYDGSRKNIAYDTQIIRANMRYLTFIWMPLWALFIKGLREFEFRSEKMRIAIIGILSLGTIVFYKGVRPFSSVDYSMLYHIGLFDFANITSRLLFLVIFSLLVIVGVILLIYRRRCFVVFFGSLLIIDLIYNNIEYYDIIRRTYEIKDADMISVEEVVLNNSDSNFILIDGSDDTLGKWHILKESKYADFYLTYKNIYRVSGAKLMQLQQETGEATSVSTLPGYTGSVGHDYDIHLDNVDYVLIANNNEYELSLDNCEIIDDNLGGYYTLYALDDPTVMPILK